MDDDEPRINGPLSEPAARIAIDRYDVRVFSHPHLTKKLDELQHWARHPSGDTVGLVIGSTGVGKSTLASEFVRSHLKASIDKLREDDYCVPAALVEMPTTETNLYNWTGLYTRILRAVSEPLPDLKLSSDAFYSRVRSPLRTRRFPARPGPNEHGGHVEEILQERNTELLVLDEAQHLCRVTNFGRLLSQMETIKAKANTSNCLYALFGTYELIDVLEVDPQLSRRSRLFHVSPYTLKTDEDRDVWKSVVHTFQGGLPLATEKEFHEIDKDLYLGSLGCVGILKEWISKTLARVLYAGRHILTEDDLKACAPPSEKLIPILDEINRGEGRLTTLKNKKLRLSESLELVAESAASHAPPPTKANGNLKPGQRKPERDRVGRTALHGQA